MYICIFQVPLLGNLGFPAMPGEVGAGGEDDHAGVGGDGALSSIYNEEQQQQVNV